jgi:hypothetical protein
MLNERALHYAHSLAFLAELRFLKEEVRDGVVNQKIDGDLAMYLINATETFMAFHESQWNEIDRLDDIIKQLARSAA